MKPNVPLTLQQEACGWAPIRPLRGHLALKGGGEELRASTIFTPPAKPGMTGISG